MAYDFELSDVLPATPQAIFEAWMSSEGHTAMTGSETTIDPRPGGAFEAGDGYITGKTVALDPGRRIVQTWRTSEFAGSDPDSEIEVLLEPVEGGTKLTLHHRSVPDGQFGYERGGWQESYFDPMKEYFSGR
jgi:activator of HSP90 ATPase